MFVLAVPVIIGKSSLGFLDLLKFTWSSEHYGLDYLKSLISAADFHISEEKLIGPQVYDPLADFYIENRSEIKKTDLKRIPVLCGVNSFQIHQKNERSI